MKTKLFSLLTTAIFLLSFCVNAQEVIDPKEEAEKEGTTRVNKKIDKGVDKGLDKVEKGIGNLFGKKKKKNKKKEEQTKENNQEQQVLDQVENDTETDLTLNWAKYDFVPGDKVIFEDNLEGEENGEFPSRWDLMRGNAEIAEFGSETVIMFRDGAPTVMPYMKNAKEDYLPDVFTIEFDLYCGTDNFIAYLYDRKNQKSGSPTGYTSFNIKYDRMEFGTSSSRHPDEKSLKKRRWIHVAIAYTNGKLKGYMDETRMINIPRLDFDPKGLSLHSYHAHNENLYYIKNIRIAEGGVKFYDRVLQDGKIIANGIRFDTGKATLKPESMGIINEITKLMQDHPDLKFGIEGHTDSDGNDTSNLKLSDERAKTVKNTMVGLGISADRLSTKGMGETVPMDTNDTPEGKANNRRVEFVKK
ncbi:OmpA family protein [Labilibaculum sp.]|uniref:OmpA family protein n=1 Tax=Labilibaculum sp. TaxID=2060723 RepID=UPI0035629642